MRLVLAGLFAFSAGASAQEAVVSGRVKGEPRVRAAAAAKSAPYDARAARYSKLFDYERLRDVVVYAEPAEDLAPSGAPAALRVEGGRSGPRFVPAFLAVSAGSALVVRNATPDAVTLFAGEGSPEELSAVLAAGEEKTLSPGALGLYRLFLLEAPDVRGRLFAAGPRFAVADASGTYRLSLPPGRRRVSAWHERLPARTQELELEPGGRKELDFVLTVKELPEVP